MVLVIVNKVNGNKVNKEEKVFSIVMETDFEIMVQNGVRKTVWFLSA